MVLRRTSTRLLAVPLRTIDVCAIGLRTVTHGIEAGYPGLVFHQARPAASGVKPILRRCVQRSGKV
jgi:hypothetical protein